jgi:hypothetical protein
MVKPRSMSSSVVEERHSIQRQEKDWGMPFRYSDSSVAEESYREIPKRERAVYEKVEIVKKMGKSTTIHTEGRVSQTNL